MSKAAKTRTHEYTGPGDKPEVLTYELPDVPTMIEVREQKQTAEAALWVTELGRRIVDGLQAADAEGGPEFSIKQELEAVSEAPRMQQIVYNRMKAVGVTQMLDLVKSLQVDGQPVALEGDELASFIVNDPRRYAAIKALRNKVFYGDNGTP